MYRLTICIILLLKSYAYSATSIGEFQTDQLHKPIQSAFEENKGQVQGADSNLVTYFYKEGNVTMFLLKTGMAYQMEQCHFPEGFHHLDKKASHEEQQLFYQLSKNIRTETYRMDIELLGSNPNAVIIAEGKSSDYKHYYNYNTLNVRSYQKITYKNIYPNIDWVIYQIPVSNNKSQIKYDFIVHPGGNPDDIKLKTKWVEELSLMNNGSIVYKNRLGQITENKPISFQNQIPIETSFIVNNNTISFSVPIYDSKQDLIIDPSLVWATYYGGSSSDYGAGCTVDTSKNLYLAGYSNSTTAIASGGYQNSFGGGNYDAFLVKFNPSGTRLWATYYGGSDDDQGKYCALDANGNIYLTGQTRSSSNIASSGHQNSLGGNEDGFLVKFNASGTRIWATYYGNTGDDYGNSIAIDVSGNIYLAGYTSSTSSIASGGHQNTIGGGGNLDAFLAKFNTSGTRIWATYYGGSGTEWGNFCSTDASGNVYLAGGTNSNTNISSGGFQNTIGGGIDAFLVKFNSAGTRIWGTYYGDNSGDYGISCATDPSGNIYIAGWTSSTTNIANGGFQNTYGGGGDDGYLAKFSSTGSRLWGTYYGGTDNDYGWSCSTDASGNVSLVGWTSSTTGIASNGYQNTIGGGSDAFLVKFRPTGTRVWGSYYGGSGSEVGLTCLTDLTGNIHLAGYTNSSSNISSAGHQNTHGGNYDAFLVKLLDSVTPNLTIKKNKPDTICTGTSILFSDSTIYGGSNPKFKWYKNNVLVDTNRTYLDTNILNGDSIMCILTSNAPFRTKDTVWSNTIRIIVKQRSFKTIYDTIFSNQFVTFNGINRNISGNYLDTLTNSNGCDSFLTLNLFVRASSLKQIYDTICANQFKSFNGSNLNTSGIYSDTLTNSVGADSFLVLNLEVKSISNTNIYDTICGTQSRLFNGYFRNTSGIYPDTLTNSKGCDSFLNLNLFVKIADSTKLFDTICANQSKLFNGINRTTTGIYLDTFTSSKGCDSFVTLYLHVKSTSALSIADTICSNQSRLFNGVNRTMTGTYLDTLINTQGCDSFLTLNLVVKSISTKTIYDTICSNQFKLFNGVNRTASGVYLDTLTNSNGCDSFLTLHLFVKLVDSTTLYDTICANQFKLFNGVNRTVSGVYLDTLTNSKGCDSFLTLNLFVKSTSSNFIADTICANQFRLFNGINRYTSGAYLDTLVNANGCDSFLTLNLYVKSTSSYSIADTICANQFRLFNGINQSTTGAYLDTLINANGCDSFLTLNLVVKPISSKTIFDTICSDQSRLFNGITRTTSGIFFDTMTNTNGCDSFLTLDLFVRSTISKTVYDTICSNQTKLFNGVYLNATGTYLDTLVSSTGCDSFLTLNLFVKNTITKNIFDTICSNSLYLFNGQYLNTSGSYKDTLINSVGCDSFVNLYLTVYPSSSYTYSVTTSCANPSYFFKGINRTISGIYIDTLKNSYGCDSFVTLNLTVRKPSATSISIVLCPGQSYFFNGANRTTAGLYTLYTTNSSGCDSIVTLNLIVLTVVPFNSVIIVGCPPYTYKGKTYLDSVKLIDTFKSVSGCDSHYFVTILKISPQAITAKNQNFTVCDSVRVKGKLYLTSFSYIDTFKTQNTLQCDSLYQPISYEIETTPKIELSKRAIDTFFKGEVVTLSPTTIKNYLWSTGETTREISFNITEDKSIYVIGWNVPECRDTAYLDIIALDPTIVDFPKGFAPNGMLENRLFKPNINGIIQLKKFEVYNRLGEKVYSMNTLNNIGWNGIYKGEPAREGTYSYIIEYTANRIVFFKTGEVVMVR